MRSQPRKHLKNENIRKDLESWGERKSFGLSFPEKDCHVVLFCPEKRESDGN